MYYFINYFENHIHFNHIVNKSTLKKISMNYQYLRLNGSRQTRPGALIKGQIDAIR